MTVSITITEQDVFQAVRTFLLAILPSGVEVVQAFDQSVPMPDGPFLAMSTSGFKPLSTSVGTYGTSDQSLSFLQPYEWPVQIDAYGPLSGDYISALCGIFRTPFSVDQFSTYGFDITPLWADDPVQMPIINGEKQWEKRFKTSLHFQVNQQITGLTQQSANALSINTINPVK